MASLRLLCLSHLAVRQWKKNLRDAHSLEFWETDRRALKQLCYTSFTARVLIILPVYRVELMLHLGKLGPV